MSLLWIALAGAAGTLARYGLARGMSAWLGASFPWGTLTVNALGCLAIGWAATRVNERGLLAPEIATPLIAGFLGAFTTFSTFAFETGIFLRQGAIGAAAANLLANQALGIGLFFVGAWWARQP